MKIPTSIVGVSLAIKNPTNNNAYRMTDDAVAVPTPTVQEKWTTAFPFHTPTAHLIMLPYIGFGCDKDNMLSDLSQEGMIGLGNCYPVTRSGSFLWYGKINCLVTLHSGSDCGGWEWEIEMGVCNNQEFASFRAYC